MAAQELFEILKMTVDRNDQIIADGHATAGTPTLFDVKGSTDPGLGGRNLYFRLWAQILDILD